jgi:hypothetical protein
MMKRIVITFDGTGLHFDRNYGSTKLTGWTALHHGSFCYPQFTSFWHAITLLIRAWRVGNSCKIRNS